MLVSRDLLSSFTSSKAAVEQNGARGGKHEQACQAVALEELCSLCSAVPSCLAVGCGDLAKAALSKPLRASWELVLHPVLPANTSKADGCVSMACLRAPQDAQAVICHYFPLASGIRTVSVAAG